MKILLIGAGYVGSHLLQTWPRPQDRFTVLTTSPEKVARLKKLAARVVVGSVDEALTQCEAVIVCVAPKEGASYEKTYLGTAQTLQAALKKHPQVDYVLYTSSTSVYGDHGGAPVDESAPLRATSPEGQVLIATEEIYRALEVKVAILRLAGIYGPGRELEKRAERLAGKELPGSGNEPTNHSHLDDITRAITFCVERGLTGIYNVVSEAHPSRRELYGKLCAREPTWNPALPSVHGSRCLVKSEKLKESGFSFLHLL